MYNGDAPEISEYIYVTGTSDAGTRVLFTYNDEQQAFEQYLDRDSDGSYETKIERGDANGDGTPFDVVDAQLALKYYAEKYLANRLDYPRVNTAIADMDGDGKVTAIDAMEILKKYAESLVGLV